MDKPLVLLVDDEPRVLSALRRQLEEENICKIRTASGAAEGLKTLQNEPGFAVVISDYMMPGINGISFLINARAVQPDATRMILTGAADLQTAIDAVNQGEVFRFLLKPCPQNIFVNAIQAGMRQYQLVTGEKNLLSKTLSGSIKIMIDLLAALSPESFAQAVRMRDLARQLAEALNFEDIWEVELAALLYHIGYVTVPSHIITKYLENKPLTENEALVMQNMPQVSHRLVKNIPRLENVANAILFNDPPDEALPSRIILERKILKVVYDFERHYSSHLDDRKAYAQLLVHRTQYDEEVLWTFESKVLNFEQAFSKQNQKSNFEVVEINVAEVETGMVLGRNVYDKRGHLVVSKGTAITDVLKYRLRSFIVSHELNDTIAIRK
jgi:CheY-like chemotaxis protein